MYRACVLLVFGVSAVAAAPRAQHQGQQVGIPPHLLRQYLAEAQQQQRDSTPIYEQQGQDTQVPARPQPQYQQQYQPQPQQQQYQYQPVQRLPYNAPAQQAQVVQYPQPAPAPRPQPRPAPRPLAIRPEEPENQEDYDPNPSYQFGFDVNDDQYTNYQNRKEQRDGNVIKGSYSVVDSDGFIRTVTYTADPKEGFKAEVSRQPTDIVVKIPTPKPQTEQLVHRPQPQAQAQPQQYYRYQ